MLKRITFSFIVIALILSGCSEFQRIQKKGTYDEKYDAALRYYDDNDWYRASVLLESIVPLTKGKKEAEDVQLKYAYCQYNQKEYYLASYYFKKFYETFPRSEHTEEASYMSAMSLARISPIHELDQTNTYKAINSLQGFINKYPDTKYMAECNAKIDEFQRKLEKKAYETAKLQFKIGHHRAAVISFDNFSTDYPDSQFNEELAYLKIQAQYLFGKESLNKVKKDGKTIYLKRDRLEEAKEYYFAFIDKYQTSSYKKSAEVVYKNTQNELLELEN